jgi:peptidoglycan/xylan/chitin deacetylase (PgdA/CDA1 family)
LRNPELVSRIRDAGHEVGNHYFRNGSTLLHSDAEFAGNLGKTEKVLGIATEPKLFRPPGGVAWPRQLRLARAHGYECVLGCAYPHDPMRPPLWYIKWLVEKNLRPGSIVILHDGISDPRRSLEALPQILLAGHAKGLRFVSIGTLIREASK